jgi:hypothetical protein
MINENVNEYGRYDEGHGENVERLMEIMYDDYIAVAW